MAASKCQVGSSETILQEFQGCDVKLKLFFVVAAGNGESEG